MTGPRRLVGVALATLGVLAGCHVPGDDAARVRLDDPASVALALLDPALDPDDDTMLAGLVVPEGWERSRAELIDALRALEPVEPARIGLVEPLEGLRRTAIDAELALAGGGSATVALDLVHDDGDPPRWRVRWFAGAGVEWPPPGRVRGDGLSTSAGPVPAGDL